MSDALLVLNAGSSSLKFSVFLDQQPPQLLLRGQIERLLNEPHFVARVNDSTVGEKKWPAGTRLGHRGAIEFLFAWGRGGILGEHRIVAAEHRHREISEIMSADGGDYETVLDQFATVGIDVYDLAAKLQQEGAKSFVNSWTNLMNVIASKSSTLAKAS